MSYDYMNHKWRKFKSGKDKSHRRILREGAVSSESGGRYEEKILFTIDNGLEEYWATPEALEAKHISVSYKSRTAGSSARSDIEF